MLRTEFLDAASPCGILQLIDALETYYPRLSTYMGHRAFQHAAMRHFERHSAQIQTMAHYAGDFSRTLCTLYPDNPELRELAWIEYALDEALMAPGTETMNPCHLLQVDWKHVQLRFTSTLRTARACTNAADIWRALEHGVTPPECRMLDEAGGFLVWRSGREGVLYGAGMLEYMAVLHVQANGNFASLCSLLAQRLEGSGLLRASSLLAGWTHSGLLAGPDTRTLSLN
jgi:hypothetical protein